MQNRNFSLAKSVDMLISALNIEISKQLFKVLSPKDSLMLTRVVGI